MSQLKEGQGITALGTFRDVDLSNIPSLTWLSGPSSGFPAMDWHTGWKKYFKKEVLTLPRGWENLPALE